MTWHQWHHTAEMPSRIGLSSLTALLKASSSHFIHSTLLSTALDSPFSLFYKTTISLLRDQAKSLYLWKHALSGLWQLSNYECDHPSNTTKLLLLKNITDDLFVKIILTGLRHGDLTVVAQSFRSMRYPAALRSLIVYYALCGRKREVMGLCKSVEGMHRHEMHIIFKHC